MALKTRDNRDKQDSLFEQLRLVHHAKVLVGIFDAIVAEYAIYNEYGVREIEGKTDLDGDGWIIPERSFFRSTIDKFSAKYDGILKQGLKAMLAGRTTAEKVLITLGSEIESDIKDMITSINYPPNADSTIKRKGVDNPLIESSRMRNSVTFKVVT